jgi:hypothetical protein
MATNHMQPITLDAHQWHYPAHYNISSPMTFAAADIWRMFSLLHDGRAGILSSSAQRSLRAMTAQETDGGSLTKHLHHLLSFPFQWHAYLFAFSSISFFLYCIPDYHSSIRWISSSSRLKSGILLLHPQHAPVVPHCCCHGSTKQSSLPPLSTCPVALVEWLKNLQIFVSSKADLLPYFVKFVFFIGEHWEFKNELGPQNYRVTLTATSIFSPDDSFLFVSLWKQRVLELGSKLQANKMTYISANPLWELILLLCCVWFGIWQALWPF